MGVKLVEGFLKIYSYNRGKWVTAIANDKCDEYPGFFI
jgi:hypothetical protein